MSEVIDTHGSHEGHSGISYGATGRPLFRSGLSWRASVFLLAGALVVLSAVFGSNDDSSGPATPQVSVHAQR